MFVLVPWHNGQWWVGSTYENDYADELPTNTFRKRTEFFLKNTLHLPYTVTDHFAAIRPSALERRPFVGMHPHIERVGIFNGMGSKGVSLAPYFAKDLAGHLVNGSGLLDEVNVQRFKRAFL
jgi:glycine/D-amino acid oxidase-like deaminating enzyme